MSSYIYFLGYFSLQIGDGIINDHRSLSLTCFIINALKFIYVPTRLEAKAADEREGCILRDDRDRQHLALPDKLVG